MPSLVPLIIPLSTAHSTGFTCSYTPVYPVTATDGVKLIVEDKCLGILEAVGEVFLAAKYRRCIVRFYRNAFSVTPHSKVKMVAKMLKAIHAQESKKLPEKQLKLRWRNRVP